MTLPLPSADLFGRLVSGQSGGFTGHLTRAILRAAEFPYTLAVTARNRWYDRDSALLRRVGVPVISVGNLTLGGTGKSPLVRWLVAWSLAEGFAAAVVSRGFGARAGEFNDEARELALKYPHLTQVQNRDRAAAARFAIEQHAANLVLLDDGFQHRRLARDLDIVVLDATEPFGFDHVFPRGTLREPPTSLGRADVVVLSRANQVELPRRQQIRDRVTSLAPHAAWCEISHVARQLLGASGRAEPLSALQGKRISAFCGIGNPSAFRHTLRACRSELVAWKAFADHHHYRDHDLHHISRVAIAEQADAIVCTRKDLVKINLEQVEGIPLWAIDIEVLFDAGERLFTAALHRAVSRYSPESSVATIHRAAG